MKFSFRSMNLRFLRRFIRHYSWAHVIALAVLAAFVLLRATDSQPVELLRFKVFDGFQQITPHKDSDQPVVIIDLDDETGRARGIQRFKLTEKDLTRS